MPSQSAAKAAPGHPYRRPVPSHLRIIGPIIAGLAPIAAVFALASYLNAVAIGLLAASSLPVAVVTWVLVGRMRTGGLMWTVRVVGDEFEWVKPRVDFEDSVNALHDAEYHAAFPDSKAHRPREVIRLYSPHELYAMMQQTAVRRLAAYRFLQQGLTTRQGVYVFIIAGSIISIPLAQCTAPDVASLIGR